MLNYLARRLLQMIPLTLGVILITFALLKLVPGDPAAVFLGPDATPDAVERLREQLGLNLPWYSQLLDYIGRVFRGDLGTSITQGVPVTELIFSRLGATLELAIFSLIIAVVIGVTLGVLAAVRRGSIIDVFAMLFAQLGVSMPVYWMAILLTLVFAVNTGLLPSIGRGMPLTDAIGVAFSGNFEPLWDSIKHLLLPAIALGANSAATISRLVRATMLEVLNEDFIRTAYAKGLREQVVVVQHAFGNALLPIISVIGLRFGVLLSSSIVTETIFAWPGLGQLTITAISQRDLPLIQGIVLTFGLVYALINLVVDMLYAVFDPRVRLS